MSNRSKTLLLLMVDLLVLFCGLSLSLIPMLIKEGHAYFPQHITLFLGIFPFWVLMYFTEGMYTLNTYNPAHLPISLIRATLFSLFISIGLIYLIPQEYRDLTPKTKIALIALIVPYMMYEWRHFFFRFFSQDTRIKGTVLIGSRETLNLACEELNRKPYLGYKIHASLIPSEVPKEANAAVLGSDVKLVAIERTTIHDQGLYEKVFSLLGSGVEVIDLAKFTEQISGKIPLASIDKSWFIEYCGHQESHSYDLLKNLIDRSVALVLIILLIPVAIVLIPILLLVHGPPIFFKQTRTGLNNKVFTLYKLRSMVIDAEKNGAQWACPGDARITLLGRFLRKTRLDELPQLINILKGEMSLVGPRPERPEIIEKELAPEIEYYNLRHLVKPGVTGWAQVTFRYGFSKEDSKEKLQFDLFYVKNRSLWLDILIIVKTIKTVLTGAGQ